MVNFFLKIHVDIITRKEWNNILESNFDHFDIILDV
jgi:hypothetical protein